MKCPICNITMTKDTLDNGDNILECPKCGYSAKEWENNGYLEIWKGTILEDEEGMDFIDPGIEQYL